MWESISGKICNKQWYLLCWIAMSMIRVIGVFGVAITACFASEGLSMWFIKRVGYRVLQQSTNAMVLRKFQCMINCASDRRCVGFAFGHVEHSCAQYYDNADSQHVKFIPDPNGEAYLKCKWSFILNIDIKSLTACMICIIFDMTKSFNGTHLSMISIIMLIKVIYFYGSLPVHPLLFITWLGVIRNYNINMAKIEVIPNVENTAEESCVVQLGKRFRIEFW